MKYSNKYIHNIKWKEHIDRRTKEVRNDTDKSAQNDSLICTKILQLTINMKWWCSVLYSLLEQKFILNCLLSTLNSLRPIDVKNYPSKRQRPVRIQSNLNVEFVISTALLDAHQYEKFTINFHLNLFAECKSIFEKYTLADMKHRENTKLDLRQIIIIILWNPLRESLQWEFIQNHHK